MPYSCLQQQKRTSNVSTVNGCPRPDPSPARGMTLGQRYHTLKGLDVGKCHTKFQLSSPEGIKVISCKRNAAVNLHLSLQVNLNLVTNVTYAHMHVGTYGLNITAKCYIPHSCQGRWGHKKKTIFRHIKSLVLMLTLKAPITTIVVCFVFCWLLSKSLLQTVWTQIRLLL